MVVIAHPWKYIKNHVFFKVIFEKCKLVLNLNSDLELNPEELFIVDL